MTKTLDFAYETTHEIKVGDDETTFTLVCKNEDLPADLTTAKLITVKIGNRSGYLREQPISIDSLAKLPTGQLKFNFGKDTLANFPTGSYCLEVWVTDAQGTSIYPSGNPLNFIVTANIENSSGANITTVAYDDFVEAMNKAASTIAKGDKGSSIWSMKTAAGGNVAGRWITDLYNASTTNLPAVNDLVIQPDGNVFSIVNVAKNTQPDSSGYAFDIGPVLYNIKGDKGDTPDLSTYTRGTIGLDFAQQDITNIPAGYRYFDTTLNKPIWYTGTIWVDALGQPPYFTVGLSRVNMSSEIKQDPSHTPINVNVPPTTDDAKTDETELNN
ncbi:hypothetical protein [Lactiplantibacillus plantarum]|uniref:hypothetical protein n=1 Tax=Lactiplantibacillus plantarum TaxID=1590 RepID=UPI003B5026AB